MILADAEFDGVHQKSGQVSFAVGINVWISAIAGLDASDTTMKIAPYPAFEIIAGANGGLLYAIGTGVQMGERLRR